MRKVAVLGSTGSIGCSALEVVRAHPERLAVTALAAGRNRDRLREQCEAFRPGLVSVATEADAQWLKGQLSFKPDILFGAEGLLACALHGEADTVLASVVGAAGLPSTEAALRAGRRVCVANKESLVVGGGLMRRALELSSSSIILVHNHPSGDPTPSAADVEMTRHVVEAGRPLRVAVHDHLVVGREGVASLKSLGLF